MTNLRSLSQKIECFCLGLLISELFAIDTFFVKALSVFLAHVIPLGTSLCSTTSVKHQVTYLSHFMPKLCLKDCKSPSRAVKSS